MEPMSAASILPTVRRLQPMKFRPQAAGYSRARQRGEEAEVEAFVQQCVDHYGRIDGIYANAGFLAAVK